MKKYSYFNELDTLLKKVKVEEDEAKKTSAANTHQPSTKRNEDTEKDSHRYLSIEQENNLETQNGEQTSLFMLLFSLGRLLQAHFDHLRENYTSLTYPNVQDLTERLNHYHQDYITYINTMKNKDGLHTLDTTLFLKQNQSASISKESGKSSLKKNPRYPSDIQNPLIDHRSKQLSQQSDADIHMFFEHTKEGFEKKLDHTLTAYFTKLPEPVQPSQQFITLQILKKIQKLQERVASIDTTPKEELPVKVAQIVNRYYNLIEHINLEGYEKFSKLPEQGTLHKLNQNLRTFQTALKTMFKSNVKQYVSNLEKSVPSKDIKESSTTRSLRAPSIWSTLFYSSDTNEQRYETCSQTIVTAVSKDAFKTDKANTLQPKLRNVTFADEKASKSPFPITSNSYNPRKPSFQRPGEMTTSNESVLTPKDTLETDPSKSQDTGTEPENYLPSHRTLPSANMEKIDHMTPKLF